MNLYERKNLCPPVYKCWWEMLVKWILWHGKALNPHTKKKITITIKIMTIKKYIYNL